MRNPELMRLGYEACFEEFISIGFEAVQVIAQPQSPLLVSPSVVVQHDLNLIFSDPSTMWYGHTYLNIY